jgi:hypothetical protein
MADGIVQVDEGVADKSLATQTVARAAGVGGVAHREEVVIGDGTTNAAIAGVTNVAAATGDYGVKTRPILDLEVPGVGIGAAADAEAAGNGSIIALLKRLRTLLGGTLAVSGPVTDAQLRASAVPVSGPVTDAQLRAAAVPVSAAALPLPTGAATEATLDARTGALLEAAPATDTGSSGLNGRLQRIAQRLTSLIALLPAALVGGRLDVNLGASGITLPVSGPVTDAQLRATPVPVSGTVAVTGPLTDTQLRATAVPVSGPLTDAQIRATALPVSGPLTDTQLRAATVPVSGTVTASGPLTDTQLRAASVPVDTELEAAAALADATANPTSSRLAALGMVFNGTTWDRLRGNTLGLFAHGPVAHDVAGTSNPLMHGAEAIAHGTNPTASTAGRISKTYANRHGIPFVMGGHPNIVTLEAAYTAAQTDTAIVTVASGLKIVVTAIRVICSNKNTVDVNWRIGFGTANTPTTTGVVSSHPDCPAGSGAIDGDGSGILGIGADGEDLRITSTVPTTGSVRVVVKYHTVES